MFHTILLSGDRPGDALAQMSPGKRKAFLPLNGRPMICYVLDVLLSARGVGPITIVANRVADFETSADVAALLTARGARGRVSFAEGAESPAGSVLKIAESLGPDIATLVTTADNPLLSVATLEQFCDGVKNDPELDAGVGLAREGDIRAAFPDSKRTFIRLGGAGFSGCNLFALMPGVGPKAARAWREVEGRRKKPWQLILHFGAFTLLRAVLGLLDLSKAFKAASKTLGLRAKPIVLDDAVAAMDVDRPEHIAIAEQVLASRGEGARASS
ncbi:MAG: NTP transferase domain-containing protein [Rhodospirillaceae bacterium]